MNRTTLFIALAALSLSAHAVEVYKCPDPNGRLVLQQLPCDGGQVVAINAPQPASGPVGMRASEKDLERRVAPALYAADRNVRRWGW